MRLLSGLKNRLSKSFKSLHSQERGEGRKTVEQSNIEFAQLVASDPEFGGLWGSELEKLKNTPEFFDRFPSSMLARVIELSMTHARLDCRKFHTNNEDPDHPRYRWRRGHRLHVYFFEVGETEAHVDEYENNMMRLSFDLSDIEARERMERKLADGKWKAWLSTPYAEMHYGRLNLTSKEEEPLTIA